MNVEKQLEDYIRERFDIGDDPDLTRDTHLFDEGFVDSLGAVAIICFVEDTFSIEVTQRDLILYPMNTINEIATVIKSKVQ